MGSNQRSKAKEAVQSEAVQSIVFHSDCDAAAKPRSAERPERFDFVELRRAQSPEDGDTVDLQKSGFNACGTRLTHDEPAPRVFSAHTASGHVPCTWR
jgi:hypothetical protein